MPVKTRSKENSVKTKGPLPNDIPQFFRLNIEVGELKSAISFYTKLLGIEGRRQAGSRCYFESGPVTLQVLDVSSEGQPHPAAKALYFTVNDLEAVYLKSGVKSGPFIRICLKTAHLHAKFMQQSIKASQSWLQLASDLNL